MKYLFLVLFFLGCTKVEVKEASESSSEKTDDASVTLTDSQSCDSRVLRSHPQAEIYQGQFENLIVDYQDHAESVFVFTKSNDEIIDLSSQKKLMKKVSLNAPTTQAFEKTARGYELITGEKSEPACNVSRGKKPIATKNTGRKAFSEPHHVGIFFWKSSDREGHYNIYRRLSVERANEYAQKMVQIFNEAKGNNSVTYEVHFIDVGMSWNQCWNESLTTCVSNFHSQRRDITDSKSFDRVISFYPRNHSLWSPRPESNVKGVAGATGASVFDADLKTATHELGHTFGLGHNAAMDNYGTTNQDGYNNFGGRSFMRWGAGPISQIGPVQMEILGTLNQVKLREVDTTSKVFLRNHNPASFRNSSNVHQAAKLSMGEDFFIYIEENHNSRKAGLNLYVSLEYSGGGGTQRPDTIEIAQMRVGDSFEFNCREPNNPNSSQARCRIDFIGLEGGTAEVDIYTSEDDRAPAGQGFPNDDDVEPPMFSDCSVNNYSALNQSTPRTIAHGMNGQMMSQGELVARSCPAGQSGSIQVREYSQETYRCNDGVITLLNSLPQETVISNSCTTTVVESDNCQAEHFATRSQSQMVAIMDGETGQVNTRGILRTVSCQAGFEGERRLRDFQEQTLLCEDGQTRVINSVARSNQFYNSCKPIEEEKSECVYFDYTGGSEYTVNKMLEGESVTRNLQPSREVVNCPYGQSGRIVFERYNTQTIGCTGDNGEVGSGLFEIALHSQKTRLIENTCNQ